MTKIHITKLSSLWLQFCLGVSTGLSFGSVMVRSICSKYSLQLVKGTAEVAGSMEDMARYDEVPVVPCHRGLIAPQARCHA